MKRKGWGETEFAAALAEYLKIASKIQTKQQASV